jgi:hypothetical protein
VNRIPRMIFGLALALSLALLTACGGSQDSTTKPAAPPAQSEPPKTEPPKTEPPKTEPPKAEKPKELFTIYGNWTDVDPQIYFEGKTELKGFTIKVTDKSGKVTERKIENIGPDGWYKTLLFGAPTGGEVVATTTDGVELARFKVPETRRSSVFGVIGFDAHFLDTWPRILDANTFALLGKTDLPQFRVDVKDGAKVIASQVITPTEEADQAPGYKQFVVNIPVAGGLPQGVEAWFYDKDGHLLVSGRPFMGK